MYGDTICKLMQILTDGDVLFQKISAYSCAILQITILEAPEKHTLFTNEKSWLTIRNNTNIMRIYQGWNLEKRSKIHTYRHVWNHHHAVENLHYVLYNKLLMGYSHTLCNQWHSLCFPLDLNFDHRNHLSPPTGETVDIVKCSWYCSGILWNQWRYLQCT